MSRWKSLWHLLNLPCRDATRLASQSLDGDLDRLERIALRAHLLCCIACRRYLRQILLLKRSLRRAVTDLEAGGVLPGPALPDDVRARIKQALRDH